MTELIRDTVFGKCLRLVSRGKILPFEEERDPGLVERYIDKEKSRRMAHHGTVDEEEKDGETGHNRVSDGESSGRSPGDSDNRRGNEGGEGRNDRRGVSQQNAPFEESRHSSDTRVGGGENDTHRNAATGHPVDPEKGRDASIVTWYSDEDSEVSFSARPNTAGHC